MHWCVSVRVCVCYKIAEDKKEHMQLLNWSPICIWLMITHPAFQAQKVLTHPHLFWTQGSVMKMNQTNQSEILIMKDFSQIFNRYIFNWFRLIDTKHQSFFKRGRILLRNYHSKWMHEKYIWKDNYHIRKGSFAL